LLGAILGGAAVADAASLDLSWMPPTQNADGSTLTDLGGYRVYVVAAPATPCGAPSFQSVAAPTQSPSPTNPQPVGLRVASLTLNTSYAIAVSAVDTAGNEGACTGAVNAAAHADINVNPASVNFGSIQTGTAVDKTFTVQNTTAASVTGTISVPAPFSIVSGSGFTLGPNASQAVTIRFRSTTAGNFASNVTFTANGDSLSRAVSAEANAPAPTPTATLTVTRTGTGTGTVTGAGISCGMDCSETVTAGTQLTLAANATSGSTFAGWTGGSCNGTANCTVTINGAMTVSAKFDPMPAPIPPTPEPIATSLSPSTMAVGSSFKLTVNGSGFVASSVVRWKGIARSTTFVSATQLQTQIGAADLPAPGSVPVTVATPKSGGGWSTSGEVMFTVTPGSTIAKEIVIDNAQAGVQDPAGGRTFTGRWCTAWADDEFGGSSLRSCGRRGDTYKWTPTIVSPGVYDVYVWLPSDSVRSTAVPIAVVHANGTSVRLFNERRAPGTWVLHGRYTFKAGISGYVQTGDVFGTAAADAVKFVPITGLASGQ
jgi:hypothetical protein